MATETLQSSNRIIVPDRAGQVVVNRMIWPVTAKSDGDKVIIGFLPADCRIHVPASQVIADGGTGAMTFDVCVDGDSSKIVSAQAVTATTFARAALSTYQLAETLGKSTANRAVYLLLSTAPTVPGGKIILDLAVFSPGN